MSEAEDPVYADPSARPLYVYEGIDAAERAGKKMKGDDLLEGLRETLMAYLIGSVDEAFRTAELHISPPDWETKEWTISVAMVHGTPNAVWSLDNALARIALEMEDEDLSSEEDHAALPALADTLEKHATALRAIAEKMLRATPS